VYDEIMQLSRRHRCLSFSAVDNILDMGYFRELLPPLAASDVDLSLFYEVKANLTRDQLRLMADAGINRIQPGIESFSTELLRMMRKGVTAIQNVQLLKWCFEFGIDPLWNILYGFPGEEPRHYEHYPRLLRTLLHLRPPSGLTPVVFERFSPYYFDREKFKLTIHPVPDYAMLYPPHVDIEKIAYYFEGDWEDHVGSPESYIRPVIEIQESWQRFWQDKSVVFHYEKGSGFLTLYDNRPLRDGIGSRLRRTTLNDLQSRIYLFCDENRSFQAIRKMLLSMAEAPPSEEQTRHLLDQFVAQGFMFREADRYLSLAVRRNPKRASVSASGGKDAAEAGFAAGASNPARAPDTVLPILA
jgi:ribosomal peptide maturation radical SAM protein 1